MQYKIELTENYLNFAYQSLTDFQKEMIEIKYICVREIKKAKNKQQRIRELSDEGINGKYFAPRTIEKYYYNH